MPTASNRLVVPFAMLALLATSRALDAQQSQRLTEAELFFELNETDGDLGIHASIDGQPWTDLVVRRDQDGHTEALAITARGTFREQGLTQLSFESAEPSFDNLQPAAFFARFPEGRYEISANALGGGRLTGTATLSHVMAAPPGNIRINGLVAAESCDEPLPMVVSPVLVDWDAVTRSHPDIGRRGPIVVQQYQLFVANDDAHIGIDLAPEVTQFTVPEAITRSGGEFKFEIIVRTEDGNNTAIESCFIVRR